MSAPAATLHAGDTACRPDGASRRICGVQRRADLREDAMRVIRKRSRFASAEDDDLNRFGSATWQEDVGRISQIACKRRREWFDVAART